MIASQALVQAMADLLAADTATLAAATTLKMKLAVNAFTPSPALALGALTEASFTGYAALDITAGVQTVFTDPLTGQINIEMLEPAGGFHWQATGVVSPAQTVYGVYLTDHTGATLYASQLLPQPVTLQASGEGLDFANARLQLTGVPFGVGQ